MPLMRQGPSVGAGKPRRVELDGIGVVGVHMLQNAGLGRDEVLGAIESDEKL